MMASGRPPGGHRNKNTSIARQCRGCTAQKELDDLHVVPSPSKLPSAVCIDAHATTGREVVDCEFPD